MDKKTKLDKKDLHIIAELDYNARVSISELAKKLNLSPQSTKYRIERLFKNKIIFRTMALVDIHKLGYYAYRVYIRLQKATEKEKKEIIDYFVKHRRSLWVVSTSGRWDMEIIIVAKNPIQINNIIQEIKTNIGQYVKNYSVSPSIVNYHFERDYLALDRISKKMKIPSYGYEPPLEKLDRLDILILKYLSNNARMNNREIARKTSVSFNTIKERIKRLESKGIIQTYRAFINLEKIGRSFYKSLITTKSFDTEIEKKMVSFCLSERTAVYLIRCFGEWDLELEAEVEDESEFRIIMSKFADLFNDTIDDYETLHVYKEHKMDYFPMADELLENMNEKYNGGKKGKKENI